MCFFVAYRKSRNCLITSAAGCRRGGGGRRRRRDVWGGGGRNGRPSGRLGVAAVCIVYLLTRGASPHGSSIVCGASCAVERSRAFGVGQQIRGRCYAIRQASLSVCGSIFILFHSIFGASKATCARYVLLSSCFGLLSLFVRVMYPIHRKSFALRLAKNEQHRHGTARHPPAVSCMCRETKLFYFLFEPFFFYGLTSLIGSFEVSRRTTGQRILYPRQGPAEYKTRKKHNSFLCRLKTRRPRLRPRPFADVFCAIPYPAPSLYLFSRYVCTYKLPAVSLHTYSI